MTRQQSDCTSCKNAIEWVIELVTETYKVQMLCRSYKPEVRDGPEDENQNSNYEHMINQQWLYLIRRHDSVAGVSLIRGNMCAAAKTFFKHLRQMSNLVSPPWQCPYWTDAASTLANGGFPRSLKREAPPQV